MKKIHKLLHDMGFSFDYRGTRYLVQLARKGNSNIFPLNKKGYVELAKMYHTSVIAIERNIRFAMTKALDNQSLDKWSSELGFKLYRRLTSAELVSILAEIYGK